MSVILPVVYNLSVYILRKKNQIANAVSALLNMQFGRQDISNIFILGTINKNEKKLPLIDVIQTFICLLLKKEIFCNEYFGRLLPTM